MSALEHRHRELNAGDQQLFGELWPNAGGDKFSQHLAVVANATFPVYEDVLHRDDVTFHAGNLGQGDDFAGAVAEAGDLHHDIDCRRDLPTQCILGNVQAAHGDHGLETAQRVAWRVRVNGGQRAVVARVHGWQHVQGFFAANLTHDDAIGTHAQRVDHQLALLHRALALNVGGARFQAHHVILMQLQLGGIFHCYDAFAVGNVRREDVQKCGLTGAGAAGDQNIETRLHAAAQEFQHPGRERAVSQQIVGGQWIAAETPDREARSIDGQRRNDGVHARTVGQAGIDHRRRFVHAATHRGNDAVDDAHEMDVVAELDGGHLQNTFALDVDSLVSVDENIRHRRIGQKRLERSQSEDFIEDFLGQALALLQVHGRGFADDQGFQNLGHLAAYILTIDLGQTVEIQLLNELPVNRRLYGSEVGARDRCSNRGHNLVHLFDGNEKKPPSEPFLVAGNTSRPANCAATWR